MLPPTRINCVISAASSFFSRAMLFHVLVFDGDAAAFFDLGCEVVVLVHLFLFRFISFLRFHVRLYFLFFAVRVHAFGDWKCTVHRCPFSGLGSWVRWFVGLMLMLELVVVAPFYFRLFSSFFGLFISFF
jgi:hypothetical protein